MDTSLFLRKLFFGALAVSVAELAFGYLPEGHDPRGERGPGLGDLRTQIHWQPPRDIDDGIVRGESVRSSVYR